MKVVYIKLVTGDDVIAKLRSYGEMTVNVVDPMVLEQIDHDEKYLMMFSRYNRFSAVDQVEIDMRQVVFVSDADSAVADYYLKSLSISQPMMDDRLRKGFQAASENLSKFQNTADLVSELGLGDDEEDDGGLDEIDESTFLSGGERNKTIH